MQAKYIPVITSLRGIAASAICFYHFVLSTANYVETTWIRQFFYYFQYGVPLFFVISGVVLPLSMLQKDYQLRQWPQFMVRRLIRLEPPYLVSILLALAYLLFQNWRAGQPMQVDGWNLLLHLGYLVPFFEGHNWLNPVFWSLAVEFQYYLLLSLVFLLLIHKSLWIRIVAYLILIGLSFLSDKKGIVCRWLPMFLMGISYVLYRYNKVRFLEFCLVLCVCIFLIYFLLDLPNLLVAILTLTIIHFFPNLNPRLTNWLGKISYSLYLIHFIVGQALVNFLSHYYRLPWQKPLVILLGFLLSVAAAWLLYRLVESPARIYARRFR